MDDARPHHAPQPLTAAQAARANQVIAAFARLFPRCFHVYERRRRPLMLGIDKVLIGQMEPAIKAGRISESDVKLALRLYTLADGYLDHCSVCGNVRIGLHGQPIGTVTEEHARRARELLSRRRARRAAAHEVEAAHAGCRLEIFVQNSPPVTTKEFLREPERLSVAQVLERRGPDGPQPSKRERVIEAIRENPGLGARPLARRIGVSHQTVLRVKKELKTALAPTLVEGRNHGPRGPERRRAPSNHHARIRPAGKGEYQL